VTTIEPPVPSPDELSAFYWEGARRGELLVQRCANCGHYLHPPDAACPRCASTELVAVAVSGRGVLYSFTVAHQAFDRAFVERVPYVLALVELVEQPGLRILTNIVGDPPESLSVGAPVTVTFETRGEWSLPQFALAERP